MQRTWVGLVFGAACGIAAGVVLVSPNNRGQAEPTVVVFLAVFMGFIGAPAGAVVGGVADGLAYLRAALPLRDGPQADYREPDPPA